MDVRQKQLLDLNTYIESVDQDLTDILENLQWERSYLLEVIIYHIFLSCF